MSNLATVQAISQLLSSQSLLAVVGGSVKQITLSNLMDSMNVGQEALLREVAWGTYLEYNSTCDWPQIGNLTMRDTFYKQIGRYLVNNAGNAAKMNPVNSAYFADGTPVTATKGHTMVRIPELYYLVTTENGSPILWQSMVPIGGNKVPERWIGAYKGAMGIADPTALVSRPDLVTADSRTELQFWQAAQVNGKDWGLVNYNMRRELVMHHLGKFGSTNAQAKVGIGLDGTGSSFDNERNIKTGLTVSLGDATGTVNTVDAVAATVQQVSFLGMEGLWGQKWEFAPGIVSNAETVYIYDGNKAANDKPPVGVDYRIQTRLTSAGGSFISGMQLGPYCDMIPKAISGGSTSYWADGHWSAPSGELWLFGGSASDGSICGLSASYASYAFSLTGASVGARLAFYGTPKLVTGSALMAM